MNAQVVRIDVPDRTRQSIQVSVTRDGDYELVALAIVVAVVAVVWVGTVLLVSVRFLVHLIWASGPQLQHLLLKRPRISSIVGKRCCDRFIRVFRPPIEIALKVLPVT